VIGSVAHYLAMFGWRRDLPTRFDVAVPVDTADRAALLAPDILPSFTTTDFAERGAQLDPAAYAADVRLQASGGIGKLALVELQNGDAAPSYVAGTGNFYAVTRYNWSSYYALAVIELGEAVAREVGRVRPVTVPIAAPPAPGLASPVPATAPALVTADPSPQVESPDPEVP